MSFRMLNYSQMFFCFSASVDSSFPTATLYFKGGAAMTVKPENYLLQQGTSVCKVVNKPFDAIIAKFLCNCVSR